MSQDNQNSQPPASREPQSRQSSQTPFWKTAIIGVLRGTIGVLETAVVKLEAESPGTEETSGIWQQLKSIWRGLLATIRSLLPRNFANQLSDTALTGIIAGIVVVIISITSTVFTSKPTEIATVPPIEEVPVPTPTVTVTVTIPPEPTPPTPQPPEETTTLPEAPTPPPEPQAEVTPSPTPQAEATPTPTPEPEPIQTPAVELTPEQTLIAAIENQVAEISDRFASGLIQSIQANFRTSNLIVKIRDDWYTLKESQQDKLASEVLQRSQELNFSHLQIVDSQNSLIARNPVVGDHIIIFKRRTASFPVSSPS